MSSAMTNLKINECADSPTSAQIMTDNESVGNDGSLVLKLPADGVAMSCVNEMHASQAAAPENSDCQQTNFHTTYSEVSEARPISISEDTMNDTSNIHREPASDKSMMDTLQASEHATEITFLVEMSLCSDNMETAREAATIGTRVVRYMKRIEAGREKKRKRQLKRQLRRQQERQEEKQRAEEKEMKMIIEAKDKAEKPTRGTTAFDTRQTKEYHMRRMASGDLHLKFCYLPPDMKDAIQQSYEMYTPHQVSVDPKPGTPSSPKSSATAIASYQVRPISSLRPTTSTTKSYVFNVKCATRDPHLGISMSREETQDLVSSNVISTHGTAWQANLALLELWHKYCGNKGWRRGKNGVWSEVNEMLVYRHWWVTDTGCLSAGSAQMLLEERPISVEGSEAGFKGRREVFIEEDDVCRQGDKRRKEESGPRPKEETEMQTEVDNDEENEMEIDQDDDKENDADKGKLEWRGWFVEREEVSVAQLSTTKEGLGS